MSATTDRTRRLASAATRRAIPFASAATRRAVPFASATTRRAIPLIAAVSIALPATAGATIGSRFKEAARSTNGVVASEHPLASKAGIEMLDRGGNAIDAAVATVFAIGVARPEMCGLGGGGFLVYRSAKGKTAALDFRETAPGEYTFSTGLAFPGPTPIGDPYFGTGHNVAGVPGVVAGMGEALRRFGTKPLAETIDPARRLAAGGVPVTGNTAYFMEQNQHRLRLYDATARIYLKDGLRPYAAGDTLVQTDYAKSLDAIAKEGVDAFYRGTIADAIAADMASSGLIPGDKGTMTKADLAGYRPIWRAPTKVSYRRHTVLGMPAPSSGGLATAEILNILEGFDVRHAGQSSADHIHQLAEAEKIAWADRNAYVGDPAFVDVPQRTMLSQAYADRRRQEIDPGRAKTYEAQAKPEAKGHTTHVSVIDRNGNAVAVTCTIEQIFGSAVVAPGTGFLLNNQLTDFDGAGTANEPQAGKRPRSSMSPTIVVDRRKRVRLVAGGAGGPSIIMGAVQAVINTVDFRLDVARAVDAERIDARGICAGSGLQLCLEDARMQPAVVEQLKARGHEITSMGEYGNLPLVQLAGTELLTGARLAASDPRNGPERAPEYDGAAAQRSWR